MTNLLFILADTAISPEIDPEPSIPPLRTLLVEIPLLILLGAGAVVGLILFIRHLVKKNKTRIDYSSAVDEAPAENDPDQNQYEYYDGSEQQLTEHTNTTERYQ